MSPDSMPELTIPLTVWTFPTEGTAVAVIGDARGGDPEVIQEDFDS